MLVWILNRDKYTNAYSVTVTICKCQRAGSLLSAWAFARLNWLCRAPRFCKEQLSGFCLRSHVQGIVVRACCWIVKKVLTSWTAPANTDMVSVPTRAIGSKNVIAVRPRTTETPMPTTPAAKARKRGPERRGLVKWETLQLPHSLQLHASSQDSNLSLLRQVHEVILKLQGHITCVWLWGNYLISFSRTR